MKVPNHPLRRFGNFLSDGPLFQKRWIKTELDLTKVHSSFRMSGDRKMLSKDRDPNWRQRWRWMVFKFDGIPPFYPIYYDEQLQQDGLCIRTLFPLSGQLFAMRVGPRSGFVTALDKRGCMIAPTPFLPKTMSGRQNILRIEYLRELSYMIELDGMSRIAEV
ncbi:MAG: hypothetical protein KBC35_02415 [Candidatus Pacebacteria bacterium]|nr:hypothetical protein [Candidatus Paceibacterota bacterium]